MKKCLIVYSMSAISVLFILYYTKKFYMNKQLVFYENDLTMWSSVVTLIIISLIVGISNAYKINKIEKQNIELTQILLKLSEQSEEQYDSICNHILNSREIDLDIFNKLQEE